MNLGKSVRIGFVLATGGLLTLVMILLAIRPIRAAGPWYVAPGGEDSNDCLSPGAPCATINGAIAKASSGDTIYVAIGTFTGTGEEVALLDKDATLSGGWDAGFTTQAGKSTIDGEGARRGIRVTAVGISTVERFIIGNGLAYKGGGVYNEHTLILENSTVRDNSVEQQGGGIYNEGSLVLNQSTVRDNGATNGGGIYNYGGATATLTDSTVSGNTASDSGGGIRNFSYWTYIGVVDLINSTVSGNTASGGGGIWNRGILTLSNSTVSGNTSTDRGGGIYTESSTVTLSNSTISGNTADTYGGGIVNASGGGVTPQNTILADNLGGSAPDCWGTLASSGYNLVGDTTGCTFAPSTGDLTNVAANLGLLLGPPSAPWYHPLLAGSPAIDAIPPAQCTVASDQRGVARPQGPACDMGAYEYTTPGTATSISAFAGTLQRTPPLTTFPAPLKALVLDGVGTPVCSTPTTFSAPASGASGTFADSGTHTTTGVTDENGIATAAPFTANGLDGGYTVTATVADVVTPATFLLNNTGWYVSPSGNDGNDCQMPTTPCATIDGPLAKPGFVAGDTVVVASGTYTDTGDQAVLLDNSVRLSGGWNAAFTARDSTSTIDGEATHRGITVKNGVTVIVEHFTVQNGLLGGFDEGGGIYNQGTLTLMNSTVRHNRARWGGGIMNWGILNLTSSSVSSNLYGDPCCGSTYGGGGIRNVGVLAVNNSTIHGNLLVGGSYPGGGIDNEGTAVLNNSTLSGNTSTTGGGIYNSGGTLTLQNTILAGNTASNAGPDCSGSIGSSGNNLLGDTADCTFSATTGDMLNVDARLVPLADFLGYFPLHPESLAIDAVPLVQCTLATDQRGAARPQGPACDVGAYEYTTPGPAHSLVAVGGSPGRTAPLSDFEVPLQALVLDDIGTPVSTTLVTFTAPASGASGTFSDSGTFITTAVADATGIATAATFTANELVGSYVVTATAGGVATPANFQMTNFLWYVSPVGDDGNDCLSPGTACATINGALAKPGFVSRDTIVVALGTYTGTGDEVVLIDKEAILSGGWDETFIAQEGLSTVDGDGGRRGIRVDRDVSAVVERFAVQNGSEGIRNGGTLTLNHSLVSGNMGIGIYNADLLFPCYPNLTLNNSTVRDNTGNEGAGIYNEGILALNNSTVSGNTASYNGGGIYNSGVTSPPRVLVLNNSTVSNNTAGWEGGGIFAAGAVTLTHTILAGNAAVSGPDCSWGTIDSGGHNLIGDSSECDFTPTTGDLIDVDAGLFPLIDLPGYHPLLPSSPVIDAGNPAGCTDHLGDRLTTDQRGAPRPVDGNGDGEAICDIGSYEFDPDNNPLTAVYLPVILRNH